MAKGNRRLLVLAAVTAAAVIVGFEFDRVPERVASFERGIEELERVAPWTPVDLAAPVNFMTDVKLDRLRRAPERCLERLELAGLDFAPLPDREVGDFCGFKNVVNVEQSVFPYSAPVNVTCPLAAALLVWEREVVRPAAEAHLLSAVARIDHAGTFACRRVGGGASGRVSEHARANAIDITGFRLADGRRIAVDGGWAGDDPAAADFLKAVRDGGCRVFGTVLGPDYNAAHRDHFHFDMGGFGICS